MRDISELVKKPKPVEKMTDADVVAEIVKEDMRMLREFNRKQPRVRSNIGKRPWT